MSLSIRASGHFWSEQDIKALSVAYENIFRVSLADEGINPK